MHLNTPLLHLARVGDAAARKVTVGNVQHLSNEALEEKRMKIRRYEDTKKEREEGEQRGVQQSERY